MRTHAVTKVFMNEEEVCTVCSIIYKNNSTTANLSLFFKTLNTEMNSNPNTNIAFWSTVGTALCAFTFGVNLVMKACSYIDYAASMGVALCYLSTAVANYEFTPRQERIYSRLSIVFGSIYCNYTQLSFVRLGSASAEVLSIVAFEPPRTVFFAIDMLGYFFMCLSVLCLGLTVSAGTLSKMLIILGIWGSSCIIIPLLPFVYREDVDEVSSQSGVNALIIWCMVYTPIMSMLALHYRKGK